MNTEANKSNKKIGLVYHLDYPGGVQFCVISLIRALNQRSITPTLLWNHPPNEKFIQKENIRVNFKKINFRIPIHTVNKYPVTIQYFLTILNAQDQTENFADYDFLYIFYNAFVIKPEIPHLRYLSGPPLLPQLEEPRKGILGIPYKSIRLFYKTFLKTQLPAFEFHRDNNYVINSQYTADLFFEAHKHKLDVVYPPIFFDGRSFDYADIAERDTVTFFSRFTPAKRPEMILKLAKQFPSRFLFMGGVSEQMQSFFAELKEKAAAISKAKIEFLPNVDYQTMLKELKRTKFYVFPAINEHFGMTTAEAVASGVIPFVHNSGGQKEIVPFEALRFNDDEFILKFGKLLKKSDDELNIMRKSLSKHVDQFSAENFNQSMLAYAGL